ncbi:MAG: hypothetical protein V1823_02740 [Chloroflexota bacterium]
MKIKRVFVLSLLLGLCWLLTPWPAGAYPRVLEWYEINRPGEGGNIVVSPSEVSEIAVGQGGTVYALDRVNSKVYRSVNDGASWEDITERLVNAGATLPASKVAIAPDTKSVVAVVANAASAVYLSTDGGDTWRNTGLAGQTGTIQAINISRQYTSAGESIREIAIGTAAWGDNNTSGQVWVLKLGQLPFWQNQGLVIDPAHTGGEVAALAYSPGYQQDNTLLVVAATGTDVSAGYQDKTWLCLGRRDTQAGTTAWDAFSGYPVAVTNEGDGAGVSISATAALPANYSSTGQSTRRAFVSYDRTPDSSDDVYRVDDTDVFRLNTAGGAAINISSIAYSGTTSSGKLLAGDVNPVAGSKTVAVRRTSDPFALSPTWHLASLPPSGPGNARLSFGPQGDTVYGATGQNPGQALDESAFSMSSDGGDNWQQLSLMDTTIKISDLAPTPDSKTLFIATYSTSGPEGIWRSTTTSTGLGEYWSRQLALDTASNRVILRLSSNYASDYTIVAAELGGDLIGISHDRGNSWKVRHAPGIVIDLAVADASNVYVALAGGRVSVTHNDAWFWEDPVNTSLTDINTLSVTPDGSILVGGKNGEVALAPAGEVAFTVFSEFGSGSVWVTTDEGYRENGIIYAGSGNRIFRKNTASTSTPELIRTLGTNRQITGLATSGGVLYGAWYDPVAGASGVERCLEPTITITEWDTTDMGSDAASFNTAPQALKASGTVDITLWVVDSLGPSLKVYDDVLSGARPVAIVPSTVPADPVSGGNSGFTITWTGLLQSTEYDVEIHRDVKGSPLVLTAPVVTPDIAFRPDTTAPGWSVSPGELAGGEYYVRLRVRNQQSGDQIRSLWSLPVKFTVASGVRVVAPYAGLMLTAPGFGATGVPLSPGFTWASATGVTEYELVLAQDAGLTGLVAGTPVRTSGPSWQYPGELDYATTYFWQVRAIAPAAGEWSPVGSFTTRAKPEPAVALTTQSPPVLNSEPAKVEIISPPLPSAPSASTQPAPEPPNRQPLVWLAVGVGTALIIGLIGLIVKTGRRFSR